MYLNNPEYAKVGDKKYKINTDFRVAVKCNEIALDVSIGDYERALAIIYVLFGEEGLDYPENYTKLLEIAQKYLSCGKKLENSNEKPDMDFTQDMDFIEASFMSDYGIDLEITEMNWWKFCSLISGLTEKCILNKVRDIRNTDLSEYKDAKTRNKIMRAMKNVALPIERTKEEEEMLREFEELFEEEGGIING